MDGWDGKRKDWQEEERKGESILCISHLEYWLKSQWNKSPLVSQQPPRVQNLNNMRGFFYRSQLLHFSISRQTNKACQETRDIIKARNFCSICVWSPPFAMGAQLLALSSFQAPWLYSFPRPTMLKCKSLIFTFLPLPFLPCPLIIVFA